MTLEIATSGCCEGHKCDNCATCKRGRCCRKDNPDYQLPKLGEWDGPIYGELGVLNDDGDKVECHCCGEWFGVLRAHIWSAHNLLVVEYRALFGLNRDTGLAGPTFKETCRNKLKRTPGMIPFGEKPQFVMTAEQRSSIASVPRRIQGKKHYSLSKIGNSNSTKTQGSKKTKTSQYIGITRSGKKWAALIGQHRKQFTLGRFSTQEEAARAYDAKARELYGAKARLNFPEDAQPARS